MTSQGRPEGLHKRAEPGTVGKQRHAYAKRAIGKNTWSKVLDYIARSEDPPPYLLIDREVVREKVALIGKRIRNSRVFYAVKANPDGEVLRFLNGLGIGFERFL